MGKRNTNPKNAKKPPKSGAPKAPSTTKIEVTSQSDWISKLAEECTSSSNSLNTASKIPLSKAERIQRRAAKKDRRQEKRIQNNPPKQEKVNVPRLRETEREDEVDHRSSHRGKYAAVVMNTRSTRLLNRLSGKLAFIRRSRDVKEYENFFLTLEAPKGKAVGKMWTDQMIQPRKNDYGGLGIARPSLYIPLRDDSFIPKFEDEFAEHINGFFGKQRTKAMKKQLNGNMLWKKLADQKMKGDAGRIGGKKISDMSPDEKIEAMMKTGIM